MRIGLHVINDISSATAINGYWLFYVPVSFLFLYLFGQKHVIHMYASRDVWDGIGEEMACYGSRTHERVCHGELVRLVLWDEAGLSR
jgi:hypothetical protein